MRRPISLLTAFVLLAGAAMTIAADVQNQPNPHCREHTTDAAVTAECTDDLRGRTAQIGADTFEPTMHAAPDGGLYYATASSGGVAVGFKPGISRSLDGGTTWEDTSPELLGRRVPPETNDPYVYVDHMTGRAFNFHMSPILLCSILSFSDDRGETWTTNPVGCGPTGAWDHQTMVAAKPRVTPTVGYPNVLVQCVNAIYAAVCARSLDGGLTWSHGVPAYVNRNIATLCGAQHGHLVSAPDGTIYLPTSECGRVPSVYVSRDDGLTWTQSIIANVDIPFTDPTVAVDDENNVYAAYVDETGALWLATSTDGAATWSEPVQAAPANVTATMPAMTAGDPGRIAIAFPGTDDLPQRWASGFQGDQWKDVEWGAYFSTSTNALSPQPTFQTVNATEDDPLERGNACSKGGRCGYQVDFIEATVTPDGAAWASFADGCTGNCATTDRSANNESYGNGVAVTVDGFDLCVARCGKFPEEAPAPRPAAGSDVVSPLTAAVQPALSDHFDDETVRALQAAAASRRGPAAAGFDHGTVSPAEVVSRSRR